MADYADKTEAPTPHRRDEARRDGKLAISAELTAAVMCLLIALLLQQSGGMVIQALRLLLTEGLKGGADLDAGRVGFILLKSMLPLLVLLLLVAVAVNAAQTRFWLGWRRDTGALDPAQGVKRLFGRRSAFALTLQVIKLSLAAIVAVATIRGRMDQIVALSTLAVEDLLSAAASLVFALAIRLSLIFVVLGVIDYLFQRRALEHDLRMTRRELRDELRRQEGDVEMKRRRRAMWQNRTA